jgi:hypothetical protein
MDLPTGITDEQTLSAEAFFDHYSFSVGGAKVE